MDEIRQDPSGSSSASGASAEGPPHRPRDAFVEKEHMFDKVVTPSDVGKLNRLVIPKQHAEKYFPLDASSNEKGLLLNFEDRTGKPWRFRYSYWNSSQSYVMTKGWSRFVKEKRLDAGDTVSFGRGLGEAGRGRFFIDWKRRPEVLDPPRLLRLPLPCHTYLQYHHHDPSSMLSFSRSTIPWSQLVAPHPPPTASTTVYGAPQSRVSYAGYNLPPAPSNPYLYLRSAALPSQMAVQVGVGGGRSSGSYGVGVGGGSTLPPMVLESVTAAASGTTAKRVRLFGVNLDCSTSESDQAEPAGAAAAYGNSRQPSLPSSVQLSLGSADAFEYSPRKGKQPISLDLEM